MTAENFHTQMALITLPFKRCQRFLTSDIEQLRKNMLREYPKLIDECEEDIDHEAGHASDVGKFAVKYGFNFRILFGVHQTVVALNPPQFSHTAFMMIENLEECLTTRELVIEYYRFMLSSHPSPSESDLTMLEALRPSGCDFVGVTDLDAGIG